MFNSSFWRFAYDHRGIFVYVLGCVSGAIVFSLNVVKLWRDNKKLKQELQAMEREQEMRTLAEAMIICATYAKQRAGTTNVTFNETELRWFLGVHGDKAFAVLKTLKEQGHAKDTSEPGEWTIT